MRDWWFLFFVAVLVAVILGCYDAGRWRPIWWGWERTREEMERERRR